MSAAHISYFHTVVTVTCRSPDENDKLGLYQDTWILSSVPGVLISMVTKRRSDRLVAGT